MSPLSLLFPLVELCRPAGSRSPHPSDVCLPLWGACVGGCLGLTLCCRMLSGALLAAVLLRAEQSGMTCIPILLILLSLTLEMCDFYKNVQSFS